jgi:hypothetical protein
MSLLRATSVAPAGRPSDTVTLAHGDRHRRRVRLATDAGAPFLLDLPEARVLRDGDLLRLDDGRLVAVRAAPEPVLEVTAARPPTSPASPGTSATATPPSRCSTRACCAWRPTTCWKRCCGAWADS